MEGGGHEHKWVTSGESCVCESCGMTFEEACDGTPRAIREARSIAKSWRRGWEGKADDGFFGVDRSRKD